MSNYQGIITVFFWLNMDPTMLKRILRDTGGELLLLEQRAPSELQVAPGVNISVGVNVPLARINSVRISWNPDKFSLVFEGPLQEIPKILSRLEASFEKHGYSLKNVVHYYELNLRERIEVDNFVNIIRNKIKFEDMNLALFSLSLSNRPAPIGEYFHEWLHIRMTPDVNSPNKWIFIQVIKRSKDLVEMINFVNELDNLIDNTLNVLKGERPCSD